MLNLIDIKNTFWLILCSVLLLFQDYSFSEGREVKTLDGPRIFIPQEVKDFGNVEPGSVLEQEFEVQNKGTKDLIIRSLNPACGCTSAVVNEPVIKPGGKSYIRLSFNTLGFRGSKEKILRIYSNDPLDSSKVVSVKANIAEDLVSDPERLELGELVRSKGFRKKITIVSPKGSVFKINEIIPKSSFIGAEVEENSAGASIVVFDKGRLPLGNVRTRLIVKTSSTLTPTIIVPLNFYVAGDLVVSPKAVNFGFVKKSSGNEGDFSRVVRIGRASEVVNARVKYVEKSNREMDADLSEDATGQYVTLRINSLAKGVIRGSLRLYTDSEIDDEKLLEVPYFAVVDADAN